MTTRGKEIPDLDANALICAAQCPKRFWTYTNTKSEPNYWSSSEDLNNSFRIAVRMFYNKWEKSGEKPTVNHLLNFIKVGYNSRSRRSDNHESVISKATQLAELFVEKHPDIHCFSLIGQAFGLGFPYNNPLIVLEDIIDLMFINKDGTEDIIVISTDSYPPHTRIREYVAYLGYTHLRKNVIPNRIISFTSRGFEIVSIDTQDENDMIQISQLARWLYISGNQAKHFGLTCNTCGYKTVCRTW